MYNNTNILAGFLTKDSQFTITPSGKKVYKFSLAVSNGRKKMENGEVVMKNNKPVYDSFFADFVAFEDAAEALVNGSLHADLSKGTLVRVVARLDGVNAYINRAGEAAASINYVIGNAYDVAVVSKSSNPREDGAQPNQQTNQQNFNQNQNFSGNGYNNDQFNNGGQQSQQFGGQQQFNNGGQQQFSNQPQFNGGQQQFASNQQQNFGGQQQFGNNQPQFNGKGQSDDLPF